MDSRELAKQLSHERDPQKRRELKEKIRQIQEEEFKRKAKHTQSGWF